MCHAEAQGKLLGWEYDLVSCFENISLYTLKSPGVFQAYGPNNGNNYYLLCAIVFQKYFTCNNSFTLNFIDEEMKH